MLALKMHPELIEAGCDEAGRGCLAGPVAAAAVILPDGFSNEMLNDSKQLSEKKRNALRLIIEREALAWCVVMVDNQEIDRLNILRASIIGMQRAVSGLTVRPQHLLIDGNKFSPHPDGIPYTTVVKGDATYMNIAAASILAKTHRDELMLRLAEQYPYYDWKRNKGYPTKAHLQGIELHGISPLHRRTFGPCMPSLFSAPEE